MSYAMSAALQEAVFAALSADAVLAGMLGSAIYDVLIDADLTLSRESLVNLKFLKSRAWRGVSPEQRRIALVFRAILDDGSY